ncbi:MAG: hypothetical protein ACK4MF_04455 [Hyphomicrobiaceae bacterium]
MRNSAGYLAILALSLTIGTVATAAAQGTYLRKDKDTINVAVKGGKLYCTRVSDGFEMCNGMSKSGNGWAGSSMKHPDMPGFMSFNGKVSMSGSSLTIKGCAVGESMCDSETWTKK